VPIPSQNPLLQINQEIIACTQCPRLLAHCRKVGQEKRRAYIDWEYWAKPVPGWGDPRARLLILGLAPGAHGSNRTGRPFTGDGSGHFLYRLLHATGFASQPTSVHKDDGLKLRDLYITAAVRCAPPGNKPTPQEISRCAPFLDRELAALKNVRVIMVLGKIAFDAYLNHARRRRLIASKAGFNFTHGAQYALPDGRILLCSYHPSLQNTNTGKLTEKMMLDVFKRARKLLAAWERKPAIQASPEVRSKASVAILKPAFS
jgi:uracil-DNA glycosylase